MLLYDEIPQPSSTPGRKGLVVVVITFGGGIRLDLESAVACILSGNGNVLDFYEGCDVLEVVLTDNCVVEGVVDARACDVLSVSAHAYKKSSHQNGNNCCERPRRGPTQCSEHDSDGVFYHSFPRFLSFCARCAGARVGLKTCKDTPIFLTSKNFFNFLIIFL